MADAYGAVVLSMSEGCKVDEELLLKKLRGLRWSNDGNDTDWTFEDNCFWYRSNVQYPTARPVRTETLYFIDEDGEEQEVPASEATKEQWDAISGTDDKQMSLADMSYYFLDCVKKGSITIAATSNEKCKYVEFESVTIDGDGCVSYVSHFVSTATGVKTQFEEYSLGD